MKTQRGERLHIGIIGKRNAGKSSLLNTLTGQSEAIVSDTPGTTTDPIYKPMEIHGIGPVVFIDTAGFDDEGELGILRVEKTEKIFDKCDGFIFLLSSESDLEYAQQLKKRNKPILFILPKADTTDFPFRRDLFKEWNPLPFIHHDKESKDHLIEELILLFKEKEEQTITRNLVSDGDLVLLVVPQDIQAPKGRLILPQVQILRELLDKKAIPILVTLDRYEEGLKALKDAPDLIITDSSCFKEVYEKMPKDTPLTSFSVLFSAYKGDLYYFVDSVKVLDRLSPQGKILISEACTHPPLEEDIGRVKIPALLRKRFGEELQIDFLRGDDFQNIKDYDLIIQCGSCMFNRQHLLSRVDKSKNAQIPMTNYGITLAYLNGILDKIALPY